MLPYDCQKGDTIIIGAESLTHVYGIDVRYTELK